MFYIRKKRKIKIVFYSKNIRARLIPIFESLENVILFFLNIFCVLKLYHDKKIWKPNTFFFI